jgi:NADH-quinone oxidoreductase subunit N
MTSISINAASYLTAAPFLAIVLTGMAVLMLDLFLPKDKKGPVVVLALLGVVISALLVIVDWNKNYIGFAGTLAADQFALLFQFVLLIVTALGILLSERYIQQKGINHGEYYTLLLFSASGAMLMAASKELLLTFVGLEILSVALYVLSGFARTEERSEEAAIKYFMLGAFSSGFFLYGIALIYGGTGTTLLSAMTPKLLTNGYSVAGVALVLVGLCFKAAIVPFHSWTPDVYQGAPTSVTAFMSAGAKLGAFSALIRVLVVFLPVSAVWHDVVWVLAALTMIVGNVVAVLQTDVKRMLAYSSIAHAGYILVGVLAGNADGQQAVLFYMLVYTFMNLGAFGVLILLARTGKEFNSVRDLQGLAHSHPWAAVMMSIFMFSLAGIPPAAGFIGKLLLFRAAIEAHLYGLSVVGLLASVVGVFYYLMIVVRMFMRPAEREFGALAKAPLAKFAVGLCAAVTLLLLFFASPVISVLKNGYVTQSAPASVLAGTPTAVAATTVTKTLP